MRLIWGALLLTWTLSASAVEGGKIISDIDGTLRRTHVRAEGLDVVRLIWQAFVGNNYFSGMPELMRGLSGDDEGACFTGAPQEAYTVSYVTSAPVHIRFLGQRFLRKSCLPQGSYHARPHLFGDAIEFKFETILSLIEQSGSDRVLLLGDNGEGDVEVYDRLAQHVRAELDVFIHRVYSAPKGKDLREGQRSFLTAADLAAQLFELGWISQDVFEKVVRVVHSDLTSSATYERVFPRWINCTDFAAEFRWPVLDLSEEMTRQITEIDQAIGDRCFRIQSAPLVTTSQAADMALQCSEVLL